MSAFSTGSAGGSDPERIRPEMTRFEARCLLSLITHPAVQRSDARQGLHLLEGRLRDRLGDESKKG